VCDKCGLGQHDTSQLLSAGDDGLAFMSSSAKIKSTINSKIRCVELSVVPSCVLTRSAQFSTDLHNVEDSLALCSELQRVCAAATSPRCVTLHFQKQCLIAAAPGGPPEPCQAGSCSVAERFVLLFLQLQGAYWAQLRLLNQRRLPSGRANDGECVGAAGCSRASLWYVVKKGCSGEQVVRHSNIADACQLGRKQTVR
jgi:hypothetical protein